MYSFVNVFTFKHSDYKSLSFKTDSVRFNNGKLTIIQQKMLCGVCTTLFWVSHFGIMLYKNVQINQYPSQQDSGLWSKVVNSIKSHRKPQARWYVQADTGFKEIHFFFFFPQQFQSCSWGSAVSWSNWSNLGLLWYMETSPGLPKGSTSAKNLQRAEGCSYVPPAPIGPYATSSSISSTLIMRGKDRVTLCV